VARRTDVFIICGIHAASEGARLGVTNDPLTRLTTTFTLSASRTYYVMNCFVPFLKAAVRFARKSVLSLWLALGLSSIAASASGAVTAESVAKKLDAFKETIATEATSALKARLITGSYTTVWRQFEDAAIAELMRILPRHIPELTATNFDDGTSGREKNRLADLAIGVDGKTIEISIKAARGPANPENDMGTFRDHPNRKKSFAAAFTFWVRYSDSGKEIRCDRVFFDRTWKFVGKSTLVDGVKYRKKDGNMRPKPWAMFDSSDSFWKSEADFETAVKRAEFFRANELIKEYLDHLSDNDQRLLYEKLKPKFEKN
jgi:hypothetical protein